MNPSDNISVPLAQLMFDAYNGQGPNPWKTWDGKDVPRWEQLNDQVRAKWNAAARVALIATADRILVGP
jgi:hypothetical protein